MDSLNDIRVLGLTHVLTQHFEKHQAYYMENRPMYGLSFAIDGEIVYKIGNKKVVSDRNHAIILPKGKTYKFECTKTGSFTVLNFTCSKFTCHDFLRIEINDPETFIRDHNTIEKLDYINKPYNRAKCLSIFYNMLSRIVTENPQNPYPVLRPAIKLIRENPFNPELTGSKLAEVAGLSEVYFRKLFKFSFGVTPKQYIQQLRISKAKSLLKDNTFTITEISEKCGYSNIYHFSKMFKEKTGVTPIEYRKTHRNIFL